MRAPRLDHISNKSVRKDQSPVKGILCRFVWFCPQITFSMCRGPISLWWLRACDARKGEAFDEWVKWRRKRGQLIFGWPEIWQFWDKKGAGCDREDGDTSQYLGYQAISYFQAQNCPSFQVIGCGQVFRWKLRINLTLSAFWKTALSPFLAALAALYLPLVVVTHCHFRIWTITVIFDGEWWYLVCSLEYSVLGK